MKRRPYNIAVGARIRLRRVALGMTLEEVATHLKTHKGNIQRYETGETGIGVETLAALGRCLQCEPEDFLNGIDKKKRA